MISLIDDSAGDPGFSYGALLRLTECTVSIFTESQKESYKEYLPRKPRNLQLSEALRMVSVDVISLDPLLDVFYQKPASTAVVNIRGRESMIEIVKYLLILQQTSIEHEGLAL